ncbi:MAG: ankyrin repeat domain-containing protein [Kiritimatiellae bacterium]|nr:ankyrin repeat domain-containing protein [Kiritimatiellia bacterium]
MKLSIFYLVCFLMSATPPTHSEFHTAFGPVEGVMVPQRTLHALDAMIEVVQVDLSIPQVAWVERASLDTLLGEISLSRSAGLQSSTVLEAGNLLNADLMFTPSFDLERREVRFDLIEVKRGSRIGTVRQKVDVNRAGTPQIGPRVLDEMSGKLAALLEQGIGIVEADPKPLVVAPLFVRHSGLDPRLDTLAPDLYQNLVTLAGTEELRMLNFAGAGAGREETKLNLLGIARVNPDSWKELADLYVWVEVESPEVEAGKLFEELRLSVHVWVWTGAGEPQSRRFPLSVGQLDHLPDRVRAFCAEVAKSTIPNAAPDPNARDRIAQSLILQSEPVLSKLKSLSPEEYILPRNVRLYRNAMAVLETAAFFTPRDLELEKRILQDRWKYYPVPNRKENIPYALRKAEEYLDFAVKKSLTNGALQPGNDAHLQPLYPLRDAFELLENASWSGRIDPYIAYALQSDLVDTYIRYCGNLVQRFEPGHIYSMKRVLQEARDFGITMLEGGRNGPEFVVKCVESFDGKPFQGDFRVLRAYNSFLAGAEFLDIYEKMKTTEPQSRPAIPHPTPTPQAKSQRSRQQPRIRTREEDTWQPILQVEKSPIPAPDIPGVRPKVVSFWEQEYVKTPRSREPISDWHVGYRDPVDRVLVHNEHRIHALHTDGRILYIGETTSRPVPDSELNQQKGKNHYGWAFDTLGHDLRDLNRLVDNPQGHQEKGHINASQLEKQPYPIRAIFRDHQTLYVGLDGGGIRTLDLENGKVDTVEASRGLTIKTVLGFSAHSGNLYAIGRWDSEVRLVRKPEGDPNFYPLPPWPGRSNGPRRARPMPPRLRSRGRGFEAHPAVTVKAFGSWVAASVGSKLHFLNTETGKWENPRFPSHATIQTITAYRNSLYVGTEMGLYRIYQPPSATEFRVSRIIEGNITALNVQDDHMWVTLVLEPRDALEAARYKRGRTSLHGNSEIALLDLASKTWIGKVHIPGFRLTMLARTGNQLWLASDVTSGPLLQLDTDKFGIAADELPFESPDILFPSRPLLAAARSGNVESVQNLLDEGEDPDQVTSRGWSALMIAADRGHEQVVQMLLEKGVSIDGTLSDGLGAIQLASAGGHLDVVRVLVEAGVDINSKGAPSRFYVPDPRNADYFPDLPPPRPRPEPPAQPRNVRAVQDEYGRISITWVPETPGAAFYEIRRYPATNGKIDPKHFRYNAVIGKVDRHTDHFLDTPYWTPYTRINAWFRSERFLVHPDTEYVYYVVARNRVERSWEQPETPSLPAGIRTTASFMPHPDARTFIEMELANKILEGGEAIDGFARGWSPLALAVISGHL